MRSLGSFQLDFRPALLPWLALASCLLLTVGCGGGYGGGSGMGSGSTAAPTITTQPASQSVSAGSAVTFSVMATGTALSYQWMFNSANISGATMASYSIASVTAANAGTYAVQVSNSYGKVTSSPAMLTVM